jgi:hypothetical protein
VAFGVDGADPAILSKIATLQQDVGSDRPSPGRVLAKMFSTFGNEITRSSSQAHKKFRPRLPTKPQN